MMTTNVKIPVFSEPLVDTLMLHPNFLPINYHIVTGIATWIIHADDNEDDQALLLFVLLPS
jgi:hypothetical protein